MSEVFAFAKWFDEDDVALLRKRLGRIRDAVASWPIAWVNQHQGYVANGGRVRQEALVFVSRKDDATTLKFTDTVRRTSTTIVDRTRPARDGSDDCRTCDLALIDGWIAYADGAFSCGIAPERHQTWLDRIRESRTLCSALIGSTGHQLHASIDLPHAGHGFALGAGDYGVEGGLLQPHVNAVLETIAPHTVVLGYQNHGGAAEYAIESADELPDDIEIDIDPSEWPDPVSALRALARMEHVPGPWTIIRNEAAR